jgi:tetratricopeptide (TPR) repeat protein
VSPPPGLDELERTVTLNRRKGDALATRGRSDGAVEAYRTAIEHADEALGLLGIDPDAEVGAPGTVVKQEWAADAAEWLGIRGGLLRRVGELDESRALEVALRSYRLGAEIETMCNLPGTYNRSNAIKLALISGKATLKDERDDLVALRDVLERRLATDEHAADDAWLWADLGDAAFLLGDVRPAVSAYTTFAEKARTDSPAATLKVLRTLVDALKASGDEDAPRIEAALDQVKTLLHAR